MLIMFTKRFWITCLVLLLLAVSLLPALNARAGSAYLLRKHTFANAGGRLQGSNYALYATFGQPSVVGPLSGANFKLNAGYLAGNAPVRKIYLPVVVR